MSFKRVEIVAHPAKAAGGELENELKTFFEERGVELVEERPDLVLSLGGDGTMLRAAQRAHAADAPLLGVNLGLLGYLTEVEKGEAVAALERVLAGDFEMEERMMLACEVDGGSFVGLNEVLVERAARQRMLHLGVEVGGERLASFDADGLLVATPTGSTAYALSAGGPIVDPKSECLVVVPVNAHMVFSRPFVLSPNEVVEITVEQARVEAQLSVDGAQGCAVPAGRPVVVKRHSRRLRLVRLSGPGFLERLRAKLRLPE
jgi:NAD+ kinase